MYAPLNTACWSDWLQGNTVFTTNRQTRAEPAVPRPAATARRPYASGRWRPAVAACLAGTLGLCIQHTVTAAAMVRSPPLAAAILHAREPGGTVGVGERSRRVESPHELMLVYLCGSVLQVTALPSQAGRAPDGSRCLTRTWKRTLSVCVPGEPCTSRVSGQPEGHRQRR